MKHEVFILGGQDNLSEEQEEEREKREDCEREQREDYRETRKTKRQFEEKEGLRDHPFYRIF